MSRFDDDGDGEGMPWELWQTVVSNALGGKRGQAALAELEEALLALPEPKLIEGHLAADGAVCAVGAYVAHRQARERGVPIATVIAEVEETECWCGHERDAHGPTCSGIREWNGKPCTCTEFDADDGEGIYDTTHAGQQAGLPHTISWHLAYLNDETFGCMTPEQRYEKVLAWTRRALGKEPVAA